MKVVRLSVEIVFGSIVEGRDSCGPCFLTGVIDADNVTVLLNPPIPVMLIE